MYINLDLNELKMGMPLKCLLYSLAEQTAAPEKFKTLGLIFINSKFISLAEMSYLNPRKLFLFEKTDN